MYRYMIDSPALQSDFLFRRRGRNGLLHVLWKGGSAPCRVDGLPVVRLPRVLGTALHRPQSRLGTCTLLAPLGVVLLRGAAFVFLVMPGAVGKVKKKVWKKVKKKVWKSFKKVWTSRPLNIGTFPPWILTVLGQYAQWFERLLYV